MRPPDFLIIGAARAGTTSLYFDLRRHPAIFMPSTKEPGNLLTDAVLSSDGRATYTRLFAQATANQLCGEATTSYSKLPDHLQVPQRAKQVCDQSLRIIFLVREPVARIVSQHRHELHTGRIDCGIDEAVRRWPRFINYSRYAMQIRPWIDAFGRDQVLIVRFETYIRQRQEAVEAITRFLGIECPVAVPHPSTRHNKAVGRRVLQRSVSRIARSKLYRRYLRGLISPRMKDRIRSLLPRPSLDIPPPSTDTVQRIVASIAADCLQLAQTMGISEPLWDLDEVAVRCKHRNERPQDE